MNSKTNTIAVLIVLAFGVSLATPAKADFVFGEPVNLGPPISQGPHLDSFGGEWSCDISEDGLSLYFSSLRTDGYGSADIWVTTRATVDDPWGEPINLGSEINGVNWDTDPSISADGLTLFFGSARGDGQGGDDIWMTQRDTVDGPWNAPVNLGAGINSASLDRNSDISSDGLTLYFRSDRSGNNDIYQATRSSADAPWSSATVSPVPNINSGAYETQPCLSSDGLALYFASDRPGTLDLYVATRLSVDSPWSNPINLGNNINTPYRGESGPSISADGLSLYFHQQGLLYVATRQGPSEPFGTPQPLSSDELSVQLSADGLAMYIGSNRPGGIGYDEDIWVSFRDTLDGPWREPVNLGANVNSHGIDGSPALSIDGLELYFAREVSEYQIDLFVSRRASTDDTWGPAVNVGATVNSHTFDYDPTLSSDGCTLIFASDRPGGIGAADLWMTQRQAVGEPWGRPVSLSGPINTDGYDRSPCLSSDGRYLFYISVFGDLGQPFLKMSRLKERRTNQDGEETHIWGEPISLTETLNLHEDIFSVSVSPDDCTLFFSSCHSRDAKTGFDIWQMDILPVVDFNSDGIVDTIDIYDLMAHWGTDDSLYDIGPTPLGDGIVDVRDLAALIEYIEPIDGTVLAHWALDEAEGDVAYDSVRGNDAVVLGNALWQPEGGQVNGALNFDGIDDYLAAPFILDPSKQPFSAFTWIKGGQPGQAIISQQWAFGDWLFVDSTGALASGLLSPLPDVTSETVITDDQWHHVGLVRDETGVSLYVDDVEVARSDTSPFLRATGDLQIGAGKYLEPGSFWTGLMDDVWIYDRVVTP